ncbi:MAG: CehA/McbA family metallohydrolase [Planctomycetaceae bacterium]|nr:CehA/McbA family metallohydrolase [Planctomycetaceae bacterium]
MHRQRIPAILTFLVTCAFLVTTEPLATAQTPGPLRIEELTADNWEQLVPAGKEVDAIYGDYALHNDLITAIIARPLASRNANMTVKTVGGSLIDLAWREAESDQLSAFYPARRNRVFQETVELTRDAEATAVGGTKRSVQLKLRSAGTEELPEMHVTWSLGAGETWLTLQTTWVNTTKKDVELTLSDDLRADAGKEQMKKSEDGSHDQFSFHDVYWKQAYVVEAPGFQIDSKSNARESVLTYIPNSRTAITLKPGERYKLERKIYVHRDLPAALANLMASKPAPATLHELTISTEANGQPVPEARLHLINKGTAYGTVVTDGKGQASVRLPAGEWQVEPEVAGKSYAKQPLTLDQPKATIAIAGYNPGSVHFAVKDDKGNVIPAKIEVRGTGDAPTPNWGPESAESLVKNLIYTPDGEATVRLQKGTYDLIISHGPEYNAEFTQVEVVAGRVTERAVTLPRVVNTNGWISADFHSHSTPSGDNTSSQAGRVLNLLCEHVEFAPCTEHNRVSTYDAHLMRFGAKDRMATVTGMELTGSPLPLNHQNVFPMKMTPRTQDGGGPQTDTSPETQMERIAAWDNHSEKLIQQNHPDVGWLFFDKDGDQKPDEGYSRTFGIMNVMEIHPIDPLLSPTPFRMVDGKPVGNQTAFNWLQLLNQGYRVYGVVNTDSHYNYHGSGGLRLWIRSSSDNPAQIQSDEMRDQSRNGRLIMSNGPFLEVSAKTKNDQATADPGDDLQVTDGQAVLSVSVQTPNWCDIDVVSILVNGKTTPELTWTRESHPDLFRKETTKFRHDATVQMSTDAHLVVVTGHRTQTLGDVVGPDWGKQHPAAVSNPIFVDVDGNGFVANKDTLGAPLPVKFKAP